MSTKASSLSDSTKDSIQPSKRITDDFTGEILCLAIFPVPVREQSSDEPDSAVDGKEHAHHALIQIQPHIPGPERPEFDSSQHDSPRLLIPKSKFSTQDLRAAAAPSVPEFINSPSVIVVRDPQPTSSSSCQVRSASEIGNQELNEPRADQAETTASFFLDSDSPPAKSAPNVAEGVLTASDPEANIKLSSLYPFKHASEVGLDPEAHDISHMEGNGDEDDVDEGNTTEDSGDEDFMEELRSATVLEAKPITVSKSAITSVFPAQNIIKMGSLVGPLAAFRPIPNTIKDIQLNSIDIAHRSVRSLPLAAAFLHKVSQQSNAGIAPKKGNIGSSISQRIKALEKISGSSTPAGIGGAENVASRSNATTTKFFTLQTSGTSKDQQEYERAVSTIRPSPPRNITPAAISSSSFANVAHQAAAAAVATAAVAASPVRSRSSSIANRLTVFETPGSTPPRGRTDSIQVTARILRDNDQTLSKTLQPPPRDPADFARLDLKQSPLCVNLRRATPSPGHTDLAPTSSPSQASEVETLVENNGIRRRRHHSKDKKRSPSRSRDLSGSDKYCALPKSRRSSLSIVRDFIKDQRKSLTTFPTSASDTLAPLAYTTGNPTRSPTRPPSAYQNSSFSRRLSMSSRRSSASRETLVGVCSSDSLDFADESYSFPFITSSGTSDKKVTSLTSRFMRRLSSSFGGVGHSGTGSGTMTGRSQALCSPGLSPTLREEDDSEPCLHDSKAVNGSEKFFHHQLQPSVVSYMGDVNVQFPDNLLWKRRSMCVDSQGCLILSLLPVPVHLPSGLREPAGQTTAAGIKRYHLGQFLPPYVPEMEVQELPNSVVLDFQDGSGLQIACEDRAGQLSVLHALQDSHQRYAGC